MGTTTSKSKNKNTGKRQFKFFIFCILVIILIVYTFMYTEKIIKPAVSSIAEVKVKSIISQMVNESVHKVFNGNIDVEKLLIKQVDNKGKISSVQSNIVMMNQLASNLAQNIQLQLKDMGPAQVRLSVGTIFGSQILSQAGPMVELKVMPIGMTKVNFKTEFESTGINQTRYKVFLEVDTQAKVIVPFSTNTIIVNNVVPIAETVIVGDVPQSYVMVPNADEILDGITIE